MKPVEIVVIVLGVLVVGLLVLIFREQHIQTACAQITAHESFIAAEGMQDSELPDARVDRAIKLAKDCVKP